MKQLRKLRDRLDEIGYYEGEPLTDYEAKIFSAVVQDLMGVLK